MKKLLNRIQSGPGLLVLFLVSLSVFFSLTYNAPVPNSLNKVFSHSQILSGVALDAVEIDNWNDDYEIEGHTLFSGLLKTVLLRSSLVKLISTVKISFVKTLPFYSLFAIPPPFR